MGERLISPSWYIFRQVELNKVNVDDEGYRLIVARINFLSFSQSKLGSNQNSFTERLIEEDTFNEQLKGHLLLRITASVDLRLKSWLIETEGDYFIEKLKASDFEEQKAVLYDLYPKNSLLLFDEIQEMIPEIIDKFGLQDSFDSYLRYKLKRSIKRINPKEIILAIKFSEAPYLLSNRKGDMYKGWVLINLERAMSSIKKRFERKLREKIDQLSARVEKDRHLKNIAIQYYEFIQQDIFDKLIKPTRESFNISGIELEGEIEDNLDKFPPCISDLMMRVNQTGYLGHSERFQLGLFLKHAGMPVDEQLQFWYSKAVDNLGISFEEFNKKAGYIIRHIYGLEGGHIDYQMPSCKTIQDKMYCRFRHASIETNQELLEAAYKKKFGDQLPEKILQFMNKIMQQTIDGYYSTACSMYLSGLINFQRIRINHPLIYLKVFTDFEKKNETTESKSEN